MPRLSIAPEHRPLAIVAAIGGAFGVIVSCCCGGCLVLITGSGDRTTAPRKLQLTPETKADVERVLNADNWKDYQSRLDDRPSEYRSDYEIEVARVVAGGPMSERVLRVLEHGTMSDFMSLRAEERLSLCHRVANQLHPDRTATSRAARARTYFDLLHMAFYMGGDHNTPLLQRVMHIEETNERAKAVADTIVK